MWRKFSLTVVALALSVACQATPAAAPAPTSVPTRVPTLAIATNVPRTPTPVPQPTTRPTISANVPIGTETRLHGGGPQTHFAIDFPAAEEWWSFALTNNQRAMREMISRELVFPIAEGTRLKVLEHQSLYTFVEILEGTQAGRTGWVRAAYVP